MGPQRLGGRFNTCFYAMPADIRVARTPQTEAACPPMDKLQRAGRDFPMKRIRFRASPADYRRAADENRPTIGLLNFGSMARAAASPPLRPRRLRSGRAG